MPIEIILSLIAIALSLISLYVSARTTWENTFRPAEIVGVCPHLALWVLSSTRGGQPTGEAVFRCVTPAFWLSNTGAKKGLVADLRILFKDEEGDCFSVYPTNLVPIEAIESPTLFNNYRLLQLGGPFAGFCLHSTDVWQCRYSFSASAANFERLKGKVVAEIQIQLNGKDRWIPVIREVFNFGTSPIHLQGLMFGSAAAEVQMNHVYSEAWDKRRAG